MSVMVRLTSMYVLQTNLYVLMWVWHCVQDQNMNCAKCGACVCTNSCCLHVVNSLRVSHLCPVQPCRQAHCPGDVHIPPF